MARMQAVEVRHAIDARQHRLAVNYERAVPIAQRRAATISTSLRLARPAIEIQLADVHNFTVTPLDKPALTQPAQCFRHRYGV